MTTKADKITALKAEYPTLKTGSDETGYTELLADDYEAVISEWADSLLAKEQAEADALAAKDLTVTKLEALGLKADDIVALIK